MQRARLSVDRISSLPQNINEQILSLLPIQDAIRTSILSKKWRYYWASIPKVAFKESMFQVSSNRCKKYKFVNAIFHVLMLRRCPLLHFSFILRRIQMNVELDQIILHLSVSNTLESFSLMYALDKNMYKLPSSFFSFRRLENLQLTFCAFEPPVTFIGFRRMRNLYISFVDITGNALRHLLINSPLLEKIILWGFAPLLTERYKFTFAELLECLPSVVQLEFSRDYVEYFAAGGIPPKISTSLAHLKNIGLQVCLMSQNELSLLLCLIRSSLKLEKILIVITTEDLLVQQTSMDFCDRQDYLSYYLNHLKYFEIVEFSNLPIEMKFVKFIMAKSPVLKMVEITLYGTDTVSFSADDELKIARELTPHPFPRASPTAVVTIENYKRS